MIKKFLLELLRAWLIVIAVAATVFMLLMVFTPSLFADGQPYREIPL